ncbi:MAG: hypothetical protein RIG63_04355 [Coleofasciculus chthonoplastes F3-SA18-01]|uniref:hypothetical protein n=1 Tax=Coleofasciculus chthonoplastes TaxID=64178 RepID=UPI0032FD203B
MTFLSYQPSPQVFNGGNFFELRSLWDYPIQTSDRVSPWLQQIDAPCPTYPLLHHFIFSLFLSTN